MQSNLQVYNIKEDEYHRAVFVLYGSTKPDAPLRNNS